MNVILQVWKSGNLILTVGPIPLETAHKLKELFGGLAPDISLDVTNLEGAAMDADDQTVQLVADWKKQHGLG